VRVQSDEIMKGECLWTEMARMKKLYF